MVGLIARFGQRKTIFAAMLAGLTSRPAATEFAFLVGIPTMFAATAYEFLKLRDAPAAHEDEMHARLREALTDEAHDAGQRDLLPANDVGRPVIELG